jgi:lipopolysaccharide export system permease protein
VSKALLANYVIKQLLIATLFVSAVLIALVLLTQSLRFLDLIMSSGASGSAFWLLTVLAIPKFLEIVVPIGLMAATLFVYNRLLLDNELIVLKGLGFSNLALARPALIVAFFLAFLLFLALSFLVPFANSSLEKERNTLRAQISNLFLREGVFNQAGNGIMVYIRSRDQDGTLNDIIIHDNRQKNSPYTVIARQGVLTMSDQGQNLTVRDGARQDYDVQTRQLKRLQFSQYTIDIPRENKASIMRWAEPDERSLFELLNPNLNNIADRNKQYDFILEIHRRFLTPFLIPSFVVMALCALLLGSYDRRGVSMRIVMAVGAMILVQSAFLASYNIAKNSAWGLILFYSVTFLPLIAGLALLVRSIPADFRVWGLSYKKSGVKSERMLS